MLFFSISKSTVPHCKVFLRSIWYQLQLLRNLRTTFVLLSVFPRSSPFFKLSFIFSFSFLSNHTIYCIHILFTTLSLILISPGHLNYELCTTLAALWILAFTFCQQVQLDLNSIKSILASASKLEGSSIMKCKVGGSLWKVPVVLLRSDTQHINTNIWVSYSINRIRISHLAGCPMNDSTWRFFKLFGKL